MRITAISYYSPYIRHSQQNGTHFLTQKQNTQNDIFIKTSGVAFCANTSAGAPLRKLRNIPCPYYGGLMIAGSQIHKIEQRLEQCNTVGKVVKVLSKYTDYMQHTERKMYDRFKEYAKTNPNKTLPDYLKEVYDESLIKLKLEEFTVLDDVDMISRELSAKTALALRHKTTRCREVILVNDQRDTFKRRILLNSLDEIHPKEDEKEVFERLKDRAIYLPTSGTSENAFVIKYANRSHEEIAKRIVRASVASIEHIKPDSLGGGNELSNFILASTNANSYRSNMPLSKFIDRFPDIPKNCQIYIDKIIYSIHRGKLKGFETYPYDVKKTLEKESDGRISLDLSKYKHTYEEAVNAMNKYRSRYKKAG